MARLKDHVAGVVLIPALVIQASPALKSSNSLVPGIGVRMLKKGYKMPVFG